MSAGPLSLRYDPATGQLYLSPNQPNTAEKFGIVNGAVLDKLSVIDGKLAYDGAVLTVDWASLSGKPSLVNTVAGRLGDVVLSKSDVGLGSVDNTSDANKPVSAAQQAALDGKAPNTLATVSTPGLLSAADKAKLDGYTVVAPAPGWAAGQLVYRTATGWALCSNTSAATAQMTHVVSQVLSATEFILAGPNTAISIPGAGWTPNLIGYVGTAGAITFTKPVAETPGTLWRTQAIRTLSATTAVVLDGVAEPAEQLQLADFKQFNGPMFVGRASGGLGPLEEIPPHTAHLLGISGAPLSPVSGLTSFAGYDPATGRMVFASAPAGVGGSTVDYSRIPFTGTVIPLASGVRLSTTVSSNTTFTATGEGVARQEILLFLTVAGSSTVTLPASWKPHDGVAYVPSGAGKTDVIEVLVTSSDTIYRVKYANINTDNVAPTLVSLTVYESSVVGVFSESVKFGAGGSGGLALSLSGGAVTVGTPTGANTNTLTWPLTGRTVYSNETGTGTYTQPGNGIEDIAGNDLATFTTGASGVPALANGSTASNFIENVGFNTLATTPPRWSSTGSGVVFGDNTIAMEGAGNLKIPANFAGSAILSLTQSYSELHGRVYVVANVLASSGGILLRNSSNQNQAFILLRTGTTGPRMEMGTGSANITKTLAAGNAYTLWFGYKAATSGANGEYYLTIADGHTATRPALGSTTHSAPTNGSTTGSIANLLFNCTGSAGLFQYFDKLILSTTPIPDGAN